MKYAVVGCGGLGLNLAKKIQSLERDVVVIDKEAAKVEAIRDHGMEAVIGDIRNIDPLKDILKDVEIIFIMVSDEEVAYEGIMAVKSLWPNKAVVTRSKDASEMKRLQEAAPDLIIPTEKYLTERILREAMDWEIKNQVIKFKNILSSTKGEVALFMHNNPDPDAIAAAYAMAYICEKFDRPAKIYYGGRIEHQENRALVNLLSIEMTRITNSDEVREILNNAGTLVFLDMNTPGNNNILPQNIIPNIIIDHHPMEDKNPRADLMDIRVSYGATASIVVDYLRKMELTITDDIATALLYGIRTDTARYTRHVSDADMEATAYLSRFANMTLIQQLEYSPLSIETLEVLGRSISNREVRGPYLITCGEFIKERDSLPQAADYLLRLEGINTTLVFGIVDETIHISARSNDPRVNIGQVLQEAFGKEYAGGHQSAAAAQIPLGILGNVEDNNRDNLIKLLKSAITKQFFGTVGVVMDKEEQQKEEE